MTKEQIAGILDEHRAYIRAEYGVEKIGVFGSYSKGTASKDSDIDLLIEFSRPIGFRFFELADYLEEIIGKPVDILTPAGVEGICVPRLQQKFKNRWPMSERSAKAYLQDMLQAIQRILSYVDGLDYEAFRTDFKSQDAVLRNLEVLGEAAKNIPTEITAQYPDIPWKEMARTRDRLIHHYFGVNLDVV